jgi:hypothetical protein
MILWMEPCNREIVGVILGFLNALFIYFKFS